MLKRPLFVLVADLHSQMEWSISPRCFSSSSFSLNILWFSGLGATPNRRISEMRTQLPFTLLAAALTCSLFSVPAQAQRARVFVASYGNDNNPCTFGSPCKTFQQAVNVVDPGGEITAIDSAGFGPISINKAVSITSPNGVEAGIVPISGGNAITIGAGPNDAVELYGLTVDGSGVGNNGIVFTSGAKLTI